MAVAGSQLSSFAGAFARAVAWICERPRRVSGLCVVVWVLACLGLWQIEIDFSSKRFYASDAQANAELDEFRSRWGFDDDELIVLAQVGEGDVLADARVDALSELVEELRALDGVSAVRSFVDDLSRPHARAAMRANASRWVPVFLDEAAQRSAIIVKLEGGSDEIVTVMPTIRAVEDLLQRRASDSQSGLELQLAGIPAIRSEFVRITISDQLMLGPATCLVVGLGLWWAFRSRVSVVIAGIAAGYPLSCLLGCMAWTGEPVGLLNQAYFTVLPVMAIADAVHWLVRYREESLRVVGTQPWSAALRRQVVVATGGHMGLSCLLTSATTAAGFASLLISDLEILRSFGAYAALGVVWAYLSSFVLIPLILDRWGPEPNDEPVGGSWAAELCANWVHAWPKSIVATTLVIGGLSLVSAQRVPVDNSLLDLLEDEHPVHQATLSVDEYLGGVFALEIELEGPEALVEELEMHDIAGGLRAWLSEREGFRTLLGPAWAVAGQLAPPDGPGVPNNPAGDGFSSEDGQVIRLSARMRDQGGAHFEALADELRAQLASVAWPAGVQWRVTGTSYLAYRGVNRITEELRASLLLVFAVVSFVIACMFWSLRVALLAALPNLLPLVIGVATFAWWGIYLDPLAAVVLTMALGIAVDDTIHLLVRVREESQRRVNRSAAVVAALRGSGPAIVISSVILSAGLALNLISSFPPLQQLGWLGAVIMLAALLADLLALPALWITLGPGPASGPVPRQESES